MKDTKNLKIKKLEKRISELEKWSHNPNDYSSKYERYEKKLSELEHQMKDLRYLLGIWKDR
jgi:hypothetical protein|tara:strand:- start:862 stop:1044 length:183 start_codon:yes stop_codon:yes gene_type:complete